MTDCISSTVARRLGRGRMSRSVDTSRVAVASRTEPSASTTKRSRSPVFKRIRVRIALGIVTCPLLEIVDSLKMTYLDRDSLHEVRNFNMPGRSGQKADLFIPCATEYRGSVDGGAARPKHSPPAGFGGQAGCAE